MTKKYSELRKQVYELAINLGVDTETMGGSRIGRGINNIQEAYLPMVFLDLRNLINRLGIENKVN